MGHFLFVIRDRKEAKRMQYLGIPAGEPAPITPWLPYVLILCFALVLNSLGLLHLLDADPRLTLSGLGVDLAPGWAAGGPTIDPNIGFTAQALGHLATHDLFGGRWPWWNPYEGLGAPLAGEMESAALFLLVPLLAAPWGQLVFHVVLEILAGLGMYQLMKSLGAPMAGALLAALLFEANGTYAWLANAIVNPIAFLPWFVLGIENAARAARSGTRGGWILVALSIALSLYAGFPEVAYLDGLLALCWAGVRLIQSPARRALLTKLTLGGLSGLMLAAPILVAFGDYLAVGFVGAHGGGFRNVILPASGVLQWALPYIFGPIFAFHSPTVTFLWQNIGGYAGVGLLVLAIAGAFQAQDRPLAAVLAAWVGLTVGATFGVPGIHGAVVSVPGVGLAAYFRYFPPSWAFAMCVLAGFSLGQVRSPRLGALIGGTVALVLTLLGLWLSRSFLRDLLASYFGGWFIGSLAIGGLVGFLTVLWLWRGSPRLAAAVVLFEAFLYFFLPTLANPRHGRLETGGVRYLQSHLGLQRFYSLGPLAPNYGSYYGLASLNFNDLPVPLATDQFVRRDLDPGSDGVNFTGTMAPPGQPSQQAEFALRLEAYEGAGVKYVVTPPGLHLAFKGPAPDRVFADRVMAIYRLLHPTPYFTAPGCALVPGSRTALIASCAGPSQLTRLEVDMPGWSASRNGRPTPIVPVRGVFQGISLPAGRSAIRFGFQPPHLRLALWAFGLGLAMLLGSLGSRLLQLRAGRLAQVPPQGSLPGR